MVIPQIVACVQIPIAMVAAGAVVDLVTAFQVLFERSAVVAQLGAREPLVRFHKFNAIQFAFVLQALLEEIEFLICDRLCHMLILHHTADVQRFHHNAGGFGFHDLRRCLMDMIGSDVG